MGWREGAGREDRAATESQPLRGKTILDSQWHARKTPIEPSGEREGCGQLTKGPAALVVVTAHLKHRLLSWERGGQWQAVQGSHKAQDSFLVPLGGRCSSEKSKERRAY